jgi:integrase
MKGSVRKPRTAGGTWSYRLDLGVDAGGNRQQKQVAGFRTKKDAQAALNEALLGVQHGTYVAPAKSTVGEFLTSWHETAKLDLALTAWTNYGQLIRRNIIPWIGSKRLTRLTPVDIKRWHGQLLENGRADGGALSVSSVRLAHRILHRALNDAVRWNLIMVNPATAARAPRAEHKEMNVWTADDARRFLNAVAEDRLVGLWTLALHTGLRRGELAGLRWGDLDLDAGTLTVAQQRTSANYETVVTKPKAKSQRQLLLASATVAALRGHRQGQVEERLAVGPGWKNSGYVFVDELGVEYHPQRFTKMFEDIVALTGARKIRLHDTRHTMATLALEAGIHPKVVQEQLGHSAIAVTMDTYSHVPQAVKRDSAEKIAGLFGGTR